MSLLLIPLIKYELDYTYQVDRGMMQSCQSDFFTIFTEGTRYSADDVSEIRWFDNNIAPNTRVSMSVNAPRIFKAKNYTRGFTWLWDRRPAGCIVKYEVWDTSGGRNPISRLVPVVGVYFEGARGVFMLYSNGSVSLALLYHYMKDAAPEFLKMLKEYYDDSPDWKAHRNELKDNPSTILDLYEEYLKTHDYIDDRPDVSNPATATFTEGTTVRYTTDGSEPDAA